MALTAQYSLSLKPFRPFVAVLYVRLSYIVRSCSVLENHIQKCGKYSVQSTVEYALEGKERSWRISAMNIYVRA